MQDIVDRKSKSSYSTTTTYPTKNVKKKEHTSADKEYRQAHAGIFLLHKQVMDTTHTSDSKALQSIISMRDGQTHKYEPFEETADNTTSANATHGNTGQDLLRKNKSTKRNVT